MNDSNGCGCRNEIKTISSKYKNSILLQLASYGDADMINLFDLETEKKILSPCDDFSPIGKIYQKSMSDLSCNIAIPFSSSHQYQRSDSWWARKYACEENDHLRGFKPSDGKKLLPIFQSIFFLKDNDELKFEKINPKNFS